MMASLKQDLKPHELLMVIARIVSEDYWESIKSHTIQHSDAVISLINDLRQLNAPFISNIDKFEFSLTDYNKNILDFDRFEPNIRLKLSNNRKMNLSYRPQYDYSNSILYDITFSLYGDGVFKLSEIEKTLNIIKDVVSNSRFSLEAQLSPIRFNNKTVRSIMNILEAIMHMRRDFDSVSISTDKVLRLYYRKGLKYQILTFQRDVIQYSCDFSSKTIARPTEKLFSYCKYIILTVVEEIEKQKKRVYDEIKEVINNAQ